MTTKVHLLADTLGRPLSQILTAGQAGDITHVPTLLDGQSGGAVIRRQGLQQHRPARSPLAWMRNP